jgi:hypothetical protein
MKNGVNSYVAVSVNITTVKRLCEQNITSEEEMKRWSDSNVISCVTPLDPCGFKMSMGLNEKRCKTMGIVLGMNCSRNGRSSKYNSSTKYRLGNSKIVNKPHTHYCIYGTD